MLGQQWKWYRLREFPWVSKIQYKETEYKMFAVIKTGGKQYRVVPGDTLIVERLLGQEGDSIQLKDVLMVSDGKTTTLGAPTVKDAYVEATIKSQTRGDKIIVFKKKRRQGYKRKNGHRQDLTLLSIQGIEAKGISLKAPVKAKASPSKVVEKSAEQKDPSPSAKTPVESKAKETKASASPKKSDGKETKKAVSTTKAASAKKDSDVKKTPAKKATSTAKAPADSKKETQKTTKKDDSKE